MNSLDHSIFQRLILAFTGMVYDSNFDKYDSFEVTRS
jgi:hypothetical protein